MTKARPRRGLVLVGLLVLAAPAPATRVRGEDAKEVAGDLKVMQGKWAFDGDDVEASWSLEGDTLKANFNDTEYVCKLKLDPTASPRTIDFFIEQGPNDLVGKTTLGIYKIDGDRVTFCVRRAGEDRRPGEFKAVEDDSFLFEIKRAQSAR
jgi:uncharacterized protein (TIGR03067 family)